MNEALIEDFGVDAMGIEIPATLVMDDDVIGLEHEPHLIQFVNEVEAGLEIATQEYVASTLPQEFTKSSIPDSEVMAFGTSEYRDPHFAQEVEALGDAFADAFKDLDLGLFPIANTINKAKRITRQYLKKLAS